MPGSKSIRVFPSNSFTMDLSGHKKEVSLCDEMSKSVTNSSDWDWNSDKTCFWLKERNIYYNHLCVECSTRLSYPIRVENCPQCKLKLRSVPISLGKIESASSKEWGSGMNKIPVVPDHMLSAAKQDLKDNPVPEAGFDWDYLKDNL